LILVLGAVVARSLVAIILIAVISACSPSSPEVHSVSNQAVIVHFDNYGSRDLSRLHALEDRLIAAVDAARVGEVDGHDISADSTDGTFYMYGPNADRLFAVVRPILEATDFTRRARVVLRYGPPEDHVREVEVRLGT
jgi:hypothetical protein